MRAAGGPQLWPHGTARLGLLARAACTCHSCQQGSPPGVTQGSLGHSFWGHPMALPPLDHHVEAAAHPSRAEPCGSAGLPEDLQGHSCSQWVRTSIWSYLVSLGPWKISKCSNPSFYNWRTEVQRVRALLRPTHSGDKGEAPPGCPSALGHPLTLNVSCPLLKARQ